MTPNQKRIASLENTVKIAHNALKHAAPAHKALSEFYQAWRAFDDQMSDTNTYLEPEAITALRADVVMKADAVRLITKF